jgi:hypothetical protein
MRFSAVAGVVCFVSACGLAQSPQATPLSQFPNGVFTASAYTNDALGINFKLPQDWSATVNPQLPTLFNPDDDSPANRCTRILLVYDSKPGDSKARGVVFAVDPDCLGVGPFPPVDARRDQLEAFNRTILKIYRKSTFFPPSGVQLYAFRGSGAQSRLFLGMAGTAEVPAPGSDATIKREPVQMNTLFVLVDVDKCWVGWAIVADDKAKDEFAKDSRMTVQ